MKLLTIPQPRASLLAGGRIVFDTRPYNTAYRGPVAIHAASSLRTELAFAALEDPIKGALAALGLTLATVPRGAIIAIAELVDVVEVVYNQDGHALPPSIQEAVLPEIGLGEWRAGLFAYRFGSVQPIEPIDRASGSKSPATLRGPILAQVLAASGLASD